MRRAVVAHLLAVDRSHRVGHQRYQTVPYVLPTSVRHWPRQWLDDCIATWSCSGIRILAQGGYGWSPKCSYRTPSSGGSATERHPKYRGGLMLHRSPGIRRHVDLLGAVAGAGDCADARDRS
jgi:hypothetical protein